MKIDGQNQAIDLLQRMQEARDAGQTDATKATFAVEPSRETTAADTTPSLDGRLRDVAVKAMDGGFKTADDVRVAVIEEIVDDRLDALVSKRTERKRLIDGLKTTLVDDPEFQKQVDDMLVMAARDIGSSDR